MRANTVRDIAAGLGLVGITASVWLKDWQLAPGIAGALLLAAAVMGSLRSRKRSKQ